MFISQLYNRYKKPIKLYWWRYNHPSKLNFGDEITPLVIEYLFGRRCKWSPPDKCDLAGAGSIIEILQKESGGNEVKVWGSGFIKEGPVDRSGNLEYLAVRGNKSLARIKNKNIPVGDPGLLVSLVYKKPTEKRHAIGLVPHYVDLDSEFTKSFESKYKNSVVINPLWDVPKIIETLKSCEYVISSSLHGLIVADAFSIPNAHIKISDKLTGGSYKFQDYESSVRRSIPQINLLGRNNLSKKELVNKIQDISTHAEYKNVVSIQKNLISIFPY